MFVRAYSYISSIYLCLVIIARPTGGLRVERERGERRKGTREQNDVQRTQQKQERVQQEQVYRIA
jgi:hypothetical protein